MESPVSKKDKSFLMGTCHMTSTSDNLQWHMPYVAFSPNWSSLCKRNDEMLNHIFIQYTLSYCYHFWNKISDIYGWQFTPTQDIRFSLLHLVWTPFQGHKAYIRLPTTQAFFWALWKERSHNSSLGEGKTLRCLMWCCYHFGYFLV